MKFFTSKSQPPAAPAAVPTAPPAPTFRYLLRDVRKAVLRLQDHCLADPEIRAHAQDLLDRAHDLNDALQALRASEDAFLADHSDRTRHTVTEKGYPALGHDAPELRERIGCFRPQSNFQIEHYARALAPITMMDTFWALLTDRATPGGRKPLLGKYYEWKHPEAMELILDEAEHLSAARDTLTSVADELHRNVTKRLEEIVRYEQLSKPQRDVVGDALRVALERHTDDTHRELVAHGTKLTDALHHGIVVAATS